MPMANSIVGFKIYFLRRELRKIIIRILNYLVFGFLL